PASTLDQRAAPRAIATGVLSCTRMLPNRGRLIMPRSNRRLASARMAYLPTRDSTNMTNGTYVAQKIITKAIFFTGHQTICVKPMIDGRTCLFVLAGVFLIVGPI